LVDEVGRVCVVGVNASDFCCGQVDFIDGGFFEKDGYKENVFVEVSLDWLTDGKDSL
jgi:hypothetical protein